jgi:hypothetical protein
MATVNCGILDGFIGKVGTVVGSFWKGTPVMRAYTRNRHDVKSERQLLERLRFKTLSELSSGFLDASIIGLRRAAAARHITESNLFIAQNFGMVVASGLDSVDIDFTGLTVAKGSLPGVHFNSPLFDTPQQVDVNFDTNLECKGAHADDEVYIFVYSPDAKYGVLSAAVMRNDGSVSVKVPSHWNGTKVQVYGFAVGAELSERPGETSMSSYIGSGTIG